MEKDPIWVARELAQFQEDAAFFDEHRDEYHREWPNQAVAVFNGAVVAHADSEDSLMTQLDELNIPRDRTYVGWANTREEQSAAEDRASAIARSHNYPNR